jgi:hypothetical protein
MFEDFASEVKYLIDTASKVREQKQKSKVTWDSWTLKQSEHRDSSQSLQYLTAIENVVALEQGSQSCAEEAISFLKLNAIKIDYNSAL